MSTVQSQAMARVAVKRAIRRAEVPEATYGPVSLVLPPDLSFEAWSAYGDTLARFAGGLMWWIGDWWLYGERQYGEMAAQAEVLGLKPGTLSTAAAVCSRIPIPRRIGSLSFAHHQAVAYMEPDEADEWLERTQVEAWTVRQLREALHPIPEARWCPMCGQRIRGKATLGDLIDSGSLDYGHGMDDPAL